MNPTQIIGIGIEIAKALSASNIYGALQGTIRNAIAGVVQWLQSIIGIIGWLANAVNASFEGAVEHTLDSLPSTDHAGNAFGAAASSYNNAIRRLIHDILPNSFRKVEGRIVSQHISDINSRLGGRSSRSPANLWGWRNTVVDPTIRDERDLRKSFTKLAGGWITFAGWLGGTDQLPSLHGDTAKNVIWSWWWFTNPWTNGLGWLLGRRPDSDGTGGLGLVQNWLANPEHQGALDDLLGILIDNSTDRYRHILTAGEAILNAEYP